MIKRSNLCASIKRIGPAKARINILFTQIRREIIKQLLNKRFIIQRKFRFPNKISIRSSTKSPIKNSNFTDLLWVHVLKNRSHTTLRQVTKTCLRWHTHISVCKNWRKSSAHLQKKLKNQDLSGEVGFKEEMEMCSERERKKEEAEEDWRVRFDIKSCPRTNENI